MTIGQALQKQQIPEALAGQCTALNVACFEEDGVTPRDMTALVYKLEWKAIGNGQTITKTSDAGQIAFGQPSVSSVQVSLLEADTQFASDTELQWELRGTDTAGNCEFVAAYGTWRIKKWV